MYSEAFEETIEQLSPSAREFFRTEFGEKTYMETKREISWRVWSMMKNPTFARIFTATRNPVDMFAEMEERRLILIDTDADLLQGASGFFGRIFIAQILQAAQRRFTGARRPVYLYVDEATAYFDENLAKMLETARKADIGIILAHQYLEQITSPAMYASIMANTATKFAGGVGRDAVALAPVMHTTADFIRDQPPHHFAAYLKGKGTYSLSAPPNVIERAPKRSDDIRAEMERRYGYEPPVGSPDTHDAPGEEVRPSATL